MSGALYMKPLQPILTADLFAPLNDALVALLRDLSPEEWSLPTVAGAWTVKDVAAHLLDTTLRRLSLHRDAFEGPPFTTINEINAVGIAYGRRLSPAMIVDMHARYGPQLSAFFESLDPFGEAKWNVSWAGEERSMMWFDMARELTEKWHHQQQIRDATGRPPLHEPYLKPVIATFVRALPLTYRETPLAGPLIVRIDDASWSLVDGSLYDGEASDPVARVTLSGDAAWRIFTRQKIDPHAVIEGDGRAAAPVLGMVSIM